MGNRRIQLTLAELGRHLRQAREARGLSLRQVERATRIRAKYLRALEQGDLEGLVVQSPVEMGYLGVKTAVDHLRGVTVELRQNTGVTLATRENMQDPIIAELLTPDFSLLLDQ